MKRRILLSLFILTVMCRPPGNAQPGGGEEQFIRSGKKPFSVDVLTYPGDSTGTSRVEVYLEIPYGELQFVNQGGFFRAAYELTISIYDTADNLAGEKYWTGKVEVDSLAEIRTRRPGEILERSLALAPGRYVFNVRLRDVETGRLNPTRLRITVPDYSAGSWMLSDVMLVKNIAEEGGKKVLTPNIPAVISDVNDSFFVFLKLYNDLGVDSGVIVADILDRSATRVSSDTTGYSLRPGENTLVPFIRPRHLGVGEFTLRLTATPVPDTTGAGQPGSVLRKTERTFRVRWLGAPFMVTDMDLAISQMQYILDRDRIDEMKELPPELKREKWLEYWSRKDPSPGTERNELMEEYYARVDYANKHFGHYTEGWKTDMGMVYIIFGAPGNVERHPFEIDTKPYEVWTYYEQNRQFVFVDATGFGDYRLQTPIWDVYDTRAR
ncbi:MAG TPA: GWxTD domain-containing protein [Bacteroidota bacterium]|nr:GWxTD domain-containing protein [Bacteroidota bacterium]